MEAGSAANVSRLPAQLPPRGPRSVSTFAVESLGDLEEVVVPCFERYPPIVKQSDFRTFATIVRSMRKKEHLTKTGFEQLVRLTIGMNANKQRSRTLGEILAGSSETAREAPRG